MDHPQRCHSVRSSLSQPAATTTSTSSIWLSHQWFLFPHLQQSLTDLFCLRFFVQLLSFSGDVLASPAVFLFSVDIVDPTRASAHRESVDQSDGLPVTSDQVQ